MLRCVPVLVALVVPGGCDKVQRDWDNLVRGIQGRPRLADSADDPKYERRAVPAPLDELLPVSIHIHAFTAAEKLKDGQQAISLNIMATDAYGDPSKAFGHFRFELHAFRPSSGQPEGKLLHRWRVDLMDPGQNRRHWKKAHPMYEFRLGCGNILIPGKRYVLVAVFDSPFTDRLFARRVFDPGQ